LESRWDSRKRPLCFIHVAVKIVFGLRYKIRNRVMTHTRFLLLTRNTPLLKLCPRRQGERSQSVPLGTLSNSLRLNFFFYLNRLLISKIIIVHQNRCTWTMPTLSPPSFPTHVLKCNGIRSEAFLFSIHWNTSDRMKREKQKVVRSIYYLKIAGLGARKGAWRIRKWLGDSL